MIKRAKCCGTCDSYQYTISADLFKQATCKELGKLVHQYCVCSRWRKATHEFEGEGI